MPWNIDSTLYAMVPEKYVQFRMPMLQLDWENTVLVHIDCDNDSRMDATFIPTWVDWELGSVDETLASIYVPREPNSELIIADQQ